MARLVCPYCSESVRDFFSHRCMRAKSSGDGPDGQGLREVTLPATAKNSSVSAGRKSAGTGSASAGGSIPPVSTIPKKKRAPAGTFDRNAYQREYMRKRRQKEGKK